MHRHRIPRSLHAAFTLLEVLVVMAIVAILMALSFVGIATMRDQVRRTEAATELKGVISACKSYQNDVGRFPDIPGALEGDPNSNSYSSYGDTAAGGCKMTNDALFDALRAIDRGVNTGHALNKRRQIYLERPPAKDARNPRAGFTDGSQFGANQGRLMDPWGAQYCIVLDEDGDGKINMGRFYSDLAAPADDVRASVAGFAMAKDGIRGAKGYEGRYRKAGSSEPPDDVATW